MRRPSHSVPVVLLLLLAAAAPLRAQAVRGVVVEPATGHAVVGAMVVLLDGEGRRIARALTDEDGGFALAAPRPGTYALRADRIGFLPTVSPAFALAAGETVVRRLEASMRPIALEEIEVEAGRRCVVRPDDGAATARVWEEARKALAVSAWAQEREIFRYAVERFDRRLEPRGLSILEETVRPRTGFSARPFVSLPARELMAKGFVQPVDGGRFFDYYAPDAEVLLSDEFLDAHCMRLVAGEDESEGLIGLAFEPVPGRRVSDIAGVLWLERRSAALRWLEFRYTGLDRSVASDRIGGRVEFEMLPGGAWVVRRWRIRMPVIVAERVRWAGAERVEHRLAAIREEGGEIRRITTAGGETVAVAERAVLAGVVFDSTRAAPLAGARVLLEGTAYAARTDAAGRFRIGGVPEGVYSATFAHPRLDSLPLAAPVAEVRLDPGAPAFLDLAVPPLPRILAAACPAPEADRATSDREPDGPPATPAAAAPGALPGEPTGMAFGTVRAPDGTPIPRAPVRLEWSRWAVDFDETKPRMPSGADRRRRAGGGVNTVVDEGVWVAETETDAAGRYRACGLPVGVPVTAAVLVDDRPVAATTFQLESETPVRRDLRLPGTR